MKTSLDVPLSTFSAAFRFGAPVVFALSVKVLSFIDDVFEFTVVVVP